VLLGTFIAELFIVVFNFINGLTKAKQIKYYYKIILVVILYKSVIDFTYYFSVFLFLFVFVGMLSLYTISDFE
jgi:hypothetical protein